MLSGKGTGLIWALGALAFAGHEGVAQTPDDLAMACVTAGGDPALCAAASVAARSVFGSVGLLSGFGSEVPGTASNLGTRIGGGPRIAFSARAGAVDMGLPDLTDPTGLGETSFIVPAVDAGITFGLFDGLRLLPTVGGFLSVDLFARASLLFLPQSEGFEGSVRAYSVGARLGVFREGFTIPGVSLSVARRFSGGFDFGDTGAGDPTDLTLNPAVTSLRATIGKDVLAVEVIAGVGWDRYTGDAGVRVADGAGGLSTASGKMTGSRFLYFGGAAMTFNIVLSVSVEGGWADGFDPVAAYTGAHDPTKGAPFGSFSLRLTL